MAYIRIPNFSQQPSPLSWVSVGLFVHLHMQHLIESPIFKKAMSRPNQLANQTGYF